MLKYTGHPLVDVGIATIVAFSNMDTPEQITEADLEAIADYMAENYTVNPLRSYLTVAFPNSGFTQPAFFTQPDKQEIYKERVLRAYRSDTPTTDEQGIFLGLPAADVSFNVPRPKKPDLPPGRVYRQHIPLLTGEDVINFHPYGDAGLPISGPALLAIQAFPLGSAKCAGRLLAVHSDNPEIMLEFARTFLQENRAAIQLAQVNNSAKMPEPHLKYRTLLIQTLLGAIEEQRERLEEGQPFSVTAYHLSNSGQGVDLAIYHLPSQVILYLKEMLSAKYSKAWEQVVRRAWVKEKFNRGQKEPSPDFKPNRNWLYEDLFRLMENVSGYAPRFIRTYFLRIALDYVRKDETDPRGEYSTTRETHLVSWKLTEPFLRRIMLMESERVENIRTLGDALAEYIGAQNDTRLFNTFFYENKDYVLRKALINANKEYAKRGHPPFLTFDLYVNAFGVEGELNPGDWYLVRDLVLIRLIEQLHANSWLGANEDVLSEATEETEDG